MSELPPGWVLASVDDLGVEVRDSARPDEGQRYELYSVPCFPTGRPELVVGREVGSTKRRVQPGDVLLCKINPRINRVWQVGPATEDRAQIASTEYYVLRTTNPALARYLVWYFQGPRFRDWIKLSVEGATGSHTRVKSPRVKEQIVPVPPIPEQRRIVAAIEEHFSRLDAAEAALRSAQLRLESLVQTCIDSEMASAFEAPLETFASERGITDGPFGSNLKSSHYTDTGPRVVRLENIGRGEFIDEETHITREHYDRLSKHCVEPGDLLVASLYHNRLRACLAPEGLGPAIVKADCIRLRPRGSTEGKFLSYALRRSMIHVWCQERVKGVGRQRLGLGGIRQLPIPNVDVDRQRAVVNRIGAIEDRTKETREIADQSLRRSAAFRRSILAAAFSGQLIPQNPSDEPASALLERKGAERAASISSSTWETSL